MAFADCGRLMQGEGVIFPMQQGSDAMQFEGGVQNIYIFLDTSFLKLSVFDSVFVSVPQYNIKEKRYA